MLHIHYITLQFFNRVALNYIIISQFIHILLATELKQVKEARHFIRYTLFLLGFDSFFPSETPL